MPLLIASTGYKTHANHFAWMSLQLLPTKFLLAALQVLSTYHQLCYHSCSITWILFKTILSSSCRPNIIASAACYHEYRVNPTPPQSQAIRSSYCSFGLWNPTSTSLAHANYFRSSKKWIIESSISRSTRGVKSVCAIFFKALYTCSRQY